MNDKRELAEEIIGSVGRVRAARTALQEATRAESAARLVREAARSECQAAEDAAHATWKLLFE